MCILLSVLYTILELLVLWHVALYFYSVSFCHAMWRFRCKSHCSRRTCWICDFAPVTSSWNHHHRLDVALSSCYGSFSAKHRKGRFQPLRVENPKPTWWNLAWMTMSGTVFICSGGASAAKEPGHFEVRTSSSQSKANRQGGARAVDLPARSFELARPGVAPPLFIRQLWWR